MSSEISVCHVISGDLWAGAEVQVLNLCLALKAVEDLKITAVVFNHGTLSERLRLLDIPVTVADEKTMNPLAITRTIVRHCKHHDVDVVHTHGFKENVLGVLAKWNAGIKASVRTVHGNPETHHRISSPLKWCTQKLDTLCGQMGQEAVVAVSGQLAEDLIKVFGPKVHKINNFIHIDKIRATAGSLGSDQNGSRAAVKAEPVLGLVGRLVPVKRVDLFIETIQHLNENGMKCQGLIFGSGPLEKSLKQQVRSCKVANRITFSGFVDPIAPHLKQLDALVMPSDHEGLPMVILEALALEIPVIAHDTGGIPEALQQGQAGWLVDQHSAQGYAQVIKEVFHDQAAISKRTKNGLDFLQTEFSVALNRDRYMHLYKELQK